MTIEDLLYKKGYTVYKLSKETGIPKTTLFDIFSGKSNVLDCRVGVIDKISKAFNCTIEDILKLDPILYNPALEKNLPPFLQESLDFIKDKRHKNNHLIDCYYCEVNSSINVCEVENIITHEHAEYLRNKFLR